MTYCIRFTLRSGLSLFFPSTEKKHLRGYFELSMYFPFLEVLPKGVEAEKQNKSKLGFLGQNVSGHEKLISDESGQMV